MGTVLIGIGILLFGGGFFARQVRSVPQRAWAGPRTPGQKQRGTTPQRSVRQEVKLTWEKAKAQDWLALRSHERKTGTGHASPATERPRRRLWLSLPSRRSDPGQSYEELRDTYRENQRREGGEPAPPPARQSRPGSPPPPPEPPPASAPNGRNTVVTASGSAVEHMVEGVNQIHAHAQAGGMSAKHTGVKASHEGAVRFAQMAAMLSRAMSEPGQNYGPEITEPIAKAGTHLQAAAMAFSEADAAMTSLENMTVGELAQSSRQAPHHSELSENGSR